jgi:cyclopropane-fatty-acyl-phospholipid synthase
MEKMISISASTAPGWLTRLARSLLFALLRRIRYGSLLLHESDGQCHRFGTKGQTPAAEAWINDPRVYTRLLLGGSVAAAESYVDGQWDSPDVTGVVRIFAANLAMLDRWEQRFGWLAAPANALRRWRLRNTRSQSRYNIAAHYDLGNELYSAFLDESMLYSCARFPSPQATLEQAQQQKLEDICQRLRLGPGDHLLEIGSGWGALAIHAARHYGCRVTTTTISEEQYAYASERIRQAGLEQRITLLKQDYRELTGCYDKLVSVEMIEAVGHAFLPGFFQCCAKLLKPDGLLLLQAITIADQRYDAYRKGQDFIQRYIFPGGCLPSIEIMSRCLGRHTDLVIRGLEDIGPHYAATLRHWDERLQRARNRLAAKGYDERFFRMWRYYLCYCEGGFHERAISTVWLTAARPDCRVI